VPTEWRAPVDGSRRNTPFADDWLARRPPARYTEPFHTVAVSRETGVGSEKWAGRILSRWTTFGRADGVGLGSDEPVQDAASSAVAAATPIARREILATRRPLVTRGVYGRATARPSIIV
jgi:hypothetical protein